MVTYSETYRKTLIPSECKTCRACGLYINQKPLIDTAGHAEIFWVGLSAVRNSSSDDHLPLSVNTRSGSLLKEIERPFKNSFSFYRTNLVKCLPLKEDKIRYPSSKEMSNCFTNLTDEIEEISPKLIFLLGKQVGDFVLHSLLGHKTTSSPNFEYLQYEWQDKILVPVHHPSYVLIYKRRYLGKYMDRIRSITRDHLLSPTPNSGPIYEPI